MKGNKPSILRPQILDRYQRGIPQNKIAEELNCSKGLVSQYINDYKSLRDNSIKRKEECHKRQNSIHPKIREKCTTHKTCNTCDCGIRPAKLR